MSRVEIFRGQPRRRWSEEEKRRLVAETLVPGETVRVVARRHGVNTSQLFTWRKRWRAQLEMAAAVAPAPLFAAVEIATAGAMRSAHEAGPEPDPVALGGVIEVELPRRGRVRISGDVAPALVTGKRPAIGAAGMG
jgi:transposase